MSIRPGRKKNNPFLNFESILSHLEQAAATVDFRS